MADELTPVKALQTTIDILKNFGGSSEGGLTWETDAITIPKVDVIPDGTSLMNYPVIQIMSRLFSDVDADEQSAWFNLEGQFGLVDGQPVFGRVHFVPTANAVDGGQAKFHFQAHGFTAQQLGDQLVIVFELRLSVQLVPNVRDDLMVEFNAELAVNVDGRLTLLSSSATNALGQIVNWGDTGPIVFHASMGDFG